MQENKSKLPPTPVSEILPRGNYFNENEDDLQRLLPSNMEIILFYEWTFFFYFIGDSLRHTVLSKQLFETESADIKFCNLITYTFSASKVISHSEVDQNITNVSDLRNYCPLWPVLRLGRTKNITKTKRFPPNYVGPVKTWLKSNGYEIIGFFFCNQFCDQDEPKMLQRRKDFL